MIALDWLLWTAIDSCGDREYFLEYWNLFTVVESVRENLQGQGLCFGNRFITSSPIDHNSGQARNLSDPATVVFSFSFDLHIIILIDMIAHSGEDVQSFFLAER
jgi:hypothetical protein